MMPQHAHNFLHRLDPGPHHLDTPFVQERPGPIDRAVVPRRLEALAKQHGTHGSQIVLDEFVQPGPLLARLIRRPLQEEPARFGQEWLSSLLAKGMDFSPAHLVNRIAHVLGDMKAVQDVERVPRLLGDDL